MSSRARRPVIGVTLDAEPPGGYSKYPWYALRANYAEAVSAAGGLPVALPHDAGLAADWLGVIDATEGRFGRLDVMVANAGIGIMCKAVEMSLADWRRQTAVNLDGVILSVSIDPHELARAGVPLGKAGQAQTSRTACSSSPLTRPAT